MLVVTASGDASNGFSWATTRATFGCAVCAAMAASEAQPSTMVNVSGWSVY